MNSLSKALVSVTKLNGTNYDVWYAGLLTLLMVGSQLRRILGTALETFKVNMDKELTTIVAAVRSAVKFTDDAKFKELNSVHWECGGCTVFDFHMVTACFCYARRPADVRESFFRGS